MAHPRLPRFGFRKEPVTRPLGFGIAFVFVCACFNAAEASDDLKKWLTSSLAKENGSKFAQTTDRGQAAQTQAPEKNWSINAGVKGYYDDWRNDATPKEKGSQFTEIYTLGVDISKLFISSGNLSVLAEGGTIQSEITSGRTEKHLDVATDTTLIATYSTFDWKTWGLEGSVNFNFPTGKTRLTELELNAAPNPSVVSRSVQGRGFDAGIGLKYLQQINQLHTYTGGGYTRRGAYDGTKERHGDTVGPGDEYTVSLGGNYQFNTIFNLGTDGSYTRSQGIGDQDGNAFTIQIPARLALDRLSATGRYSFTYSDSQPSKATILVRQQEFQKGFTNTWDVEVGYKVLEALTAKALAEGAFNDTEKPADPTFFQTNSRYAFGLGVSWAMPWLPLTVDAVGKYFTVFTEGSNATEVTFTGFSFLVGVTGRF